MARLGNVFNNKEDIKKEEQHPRRTIKWIHYTKLKENLDFLTKTIGNFYQNSINESQNRKELTYQKFY